MSAGLRKVQECVEIMIIGVDGKKWMDLFNRTGES